MSTEPKLGTGSNPRHAFSWGKVEHKKLDDCDDWREGESAPAEQFDENWLRSRHFFVTGCNKGALGTLDDALAYAAHVREAAQMKIATLEKELEVCALAREVHIKRAEAAERKLAESESGLNQLLFALGCQLGGAQSALQVIDAKNAHIETADLKLAEVEKVLLVLRAETCGCSSGEPNWHSSRCRMPKIEAVLASLRAYPLHMTDPIVEKAANGEKCEHCHTPLAVLNGLLVHSITLSRECPTAGNLTGRAESKEG